MDTKLKNNTNIKYTKQQEKQLSKGKMLAKERINYLKDQDCELNIIDELVTNRCNHFEMQKNKIDGDGVITGICKINSKPIAIFSQDFTVYGGSLGEMHAKKICKLMKIALTNKIPLICINDSGGARIQEGINSLAGYGDVFFQNVQCSGKIPQISVIMGPCAGGAAYSPALTDFIVMVKNISYMFVTGTSVIKKTTFEDISNEELGGAAIHAEKSGIADILANNEFEALSLTRKLLDYLPSNNQKMPTRSSLRDSKRNIEILNKIIPVNKKQSYDMNIVIKSILDFDEFFEIKKHYAKNIIIGFGRLDGYVVGVVANQPSVMAGCLDINSSCKAARFIRFCNSFNIPIISLVDIPGFLPDKQQEHDGIIRHGSKLIYAYAESSVPKITVILRKAYGGAYIVMGSAHLGADFNLAWPSAEIAVMGTEAATEIMFNKKKYTQEKKQQLVDYYNNEVVNLKNSAAFGHIDKIIQPSATRHELINALEIIINKQKNNQDIAGNIYL